MIPMVDLTAQYCQLKKEIEAAVLNVLASGQFILGPEVKAFEQESAEYLGVKHAISVANGTDALHLALNACGIKPGDEVITTPFTFIATGEAICYLGANPVFVDIEKSSFNLDVEKLEAAITPKTKAILPVHLFGQPANMPEIMAVAKTHGLKVIEDAAQAFGAHINNQKVGGLGDVACFSFYPSKNLGGYGDGGLITTNNSEIATRLLQLRDHGRSHQYFHDIIGYNSRLDEIQAAILRIKLKYIDEYNAQRRRVAQKYTELLGDFVTTPSEQPGYYHVYHQYTLLSQYRDSIRDALREQEIASAIYYPLPLHRQKAFGNSYDGSSFPNTEIASELCLSLPIYPELTNDKIENIVSIIKQVLHEKDTAIHR